MKAHHKGVSDRAQLGFWIYLMTDLVLFASLFATFVVLRGATAGGPSESELYSLPFILTETMLLLASSFTCGLAMLALKSGARSQALWLFAATFLFGAGFLAMELYEFKELMHEGHSWRESASLSSFFVLVATHGLHIFFGLLWLTVLCVRLIKQGITDNSIRRFGLFSMFWHFLDVVWIFIFTIVYLMGAMS